MYATARIFPGSLLAYGALRLLIGNIQPLTDDDYFNPLSGEDACDRNQSNPLNFPSK